MKVISKLILGDLKFFITEITLFWAHRSVLIGMWGFCRCSMGMGMPIWYYQSHCILLDCLCIFIRATVFYSTVHLVVFVRGQLWTLFWPFCCLWYQVIIPLYLTNPSNHRHICSKHMKIACLLCNSIKFLNDLVLN